jgi:predicted phosphodiesterase
MTGGNSIARPLLVVYVAWITTMVIATALPAAAACQGTSCRILVVGDMGIGDDAFTPGFLAVQQAMVQDAPDLVLFAGDYIYAKNTCLGQTPSGVMPPYVAQVRDKLVTPFQGQVVFVRGDNDAPEGDGEWEKAARACWQMIAGMSAPLTKPPGAKAWEGVKEDLPGVFVAALDHDALAAPKLGTLDWLRDPIQRAKAAGKWVLVVVHVPVVTTAWYKTPCCATLKPLHDMGVDLVFSGHQHSFERTYQLEIPTPPDRIQPVQTPARALYRAGTYQAGQGVVYVVTGGGGAWLRPFADQQPPPKPVAPPHIQRAVARRAIMNHYVRVDLDAGRVGVTTMRVCAPGEPRWHPTDATTWPGGPSMLECHDKPPGVSVFDHFELTRAKPLLLGAD